MNVTFQIAEHLTDVKLLDGFVLESDSPKVGREVDPHKVGLQMGFVLAYQVLKIKDKTLTRSFVVVYKETMIIMFPSRSGTISNFSSMTEEHLQD